MRHGDEGLQVMEWLYGRLTGSQELADALGVPLEGLDARVWPDPAPAGTPAPFVVYSAGESLDTQAMGPFHRIHTTVPATVKGLDKARDYGRLGPVARAVYAALVGRVGDPVPDGGTVLSCRREGGVMYPETAQGIDYRHLGHLLSVEID